MQSPVGGGFDVLGALGSIGSFLGFGGTRDKGGPGMPGRAGGPSKRQSVWFRDDPRSLSDSG
jgi:hypothetical protein